MWNRGSGGTDATRLGGIRHVSKGTGFVITADWAVELAVGVKVIAMDRQRVDLNGVPPPQGEIHVFRRLNCALIVFRNYPLLSFGNRIPDVVAQG